MEILMMHTHHYIILLTIFVACTSRTMDNGESSFSDKVLAWIGSCGARADQTIREDEALMSEEKVHGIAKELHSKIKSLTNIDCVDDLKRVEPKAVQNLIIREVEALKFTDDLNDRIFDAYMPLHRLTETINVGAKILCYALSDNHNKIPGGNKIAFALGSRDDVILGIKHQLENGDWWWSLTLSSNMDKRLKYIDQIYWNSEGTIYTIHTLRNGERTYALELKATENLRVYSIEKHNRAGKSSDFWESFYKTRNIKDKRNQRSDGDIIIEKINDTTINICTAVSSVAMMNFYLVQEYERKCKALQ